MTKKKKLKRAVRTRAERTGLSYEATLQATPPEVKPEKATQDKPLIGQTELSFDVKKDLISLYLFNEASEARQKLLNSCLNLLEPQWSKWMVVLPLKSKVVARAAQYYRYGCAQCLTRLDLIQAIFKKQGFHEELRATDQLLVDTVKAYLKDEPVPEETVGGLDIQ